MGDNYRLSIDFRWYLAPIGRSNYAFTNHSKFVESLSRNFESSQDERDNFQGKKSREILEELDQKRVAVGGKFRRERVRRIIYGDPRTDTSVPARNKRKRSLTTSF